MYLHPGFSAYSKGHYPAIKFGIGPEHPPIKDTLISTTQANSRKSSSSKNTFFHPFQERISFKRVLQSVGEVSLIMAALTLFTAFIDFYRGAGPLPQVKPRDKKVFKLSREVNHTKALYAGGTPEQFWYALQPTLTILRRGGLEEVATWFQDLHEQGQVNYFSNFKDAKAKKEKHTCAFFNHLNQTLDIFPSFVIRSDEDKAFILAHEYAHSRQGMLSVCYYSLFDPEGIEKGPDEFERKVMALWGYSPRNHKD
jgi:hypothetical protein